MTIDLSKMITESRNAASTNIDQLSTAEMLKVINDEDKLVPLAVEKCSLKLLNWLIKSQRLS